ncbi:hypothetical protein [Altererythrobacter rubellus]|uniref:Uncharacterized protein n=1 Tax=Altererythrobacter rubellus TaxID=2173831 RepID=A0A9Y2B7Q9_9SPHN|nr:hypothetical protein [Altererythrobacter rubellus]WIW95466.1 hypothetical protein QQX03_11110 [Altererythrobacter rubellus]
MSKREKFVRLAESRVNKALKDIQLIGNLSNRSAYDFDEKDLRKIFGALQKALEGARTRFDRTSEASQNEFRL